MGCKLNNFNVGEWKTHKIDNHTIEVAKASYKSSNLEGVVVKKDGKFKGFTFTEESALNWMKE